MLSATRTSVKSALAISALVFSAYATADVKYEINGWFLTPYGGAAKSTLVYIAPDYITETTLIDASAFVITPPSGAQSFEFLTVGASNPVRFDSVRVSYPSGTTMYEHFPLGALSTAGNYTGLYLSTLSVSAVPEPNVGSLVALGLLAVILVRRQQKSS